MIPPGEAFEYGPTSYFRDAEQYWGVRERLWNLDSSTDPQKQREYVIVTPGGNSIEYESKRVTEEDLIDHFEEVPAEEAEPAFNQAPAERGEAS